LQSTKGKFVWYKNIDTFRGTALRLIKKL